MISPMHCGPKQRAPDVIRRMWTGTRSTIPASRGPVRSGRRASRGKICWRPRGSGQRSPPTFPTFDFFDVATGLATSAKTLDTRALTYADRPSRIFGRLRDYIDRIETFDGSEMTGFQIEAGLIARRRLELAVPFDTTPEQVVQIHRAIDYASERGIEVNVRFVQ